MSAISYHTIPPPAILAPYVRYYWVLEGAGAYTHRSMADGCAELLFHYHGVFNELLPNGTTESSFTCGLSGPSQQHRRFAIGSSFGMFGVYLYPYAVYQLLGVPASAVSNHMPHLAHLPAIRAAELQDKMMLATTHAQRATIISQHLIGLLHHAKPARPGITQTIKHIIDTQGTADVATLASQSCLSVRQFERSFKEYAGFSPKLFTRIIRFQKTLAQYGTPHLSLTHIAHAAGYYDQSHFIQDFKSFSGHNPKTYFSGGEGTEWK